MQISSKKDPSVNSSKNWLKTLNWQERRKLERERKQQEEDEQTLAKLYDVRDLGVGVVKILLPSVCLMSKLASLLAMFTLFGSWIVNCF